MKTKAPAPAQAPVTASRTTKPWSVNPRTSERFDEVTETLAIATGITIDRSKLLTALAELLISSHEQVNPADIYNAETLKEGIGKAIAAHVVGQSLGGLQVGNVARKKG